MTIRVACESCGTNLKVADSAAGRSVSCPKCHVVVAVPHEIEATDDEPVRAKRRPLRPKGDSGPSSTLTVALIGAGVLVIAVVIGAIVLVRHFQKDSGSEHPAGTSSETKSGIGNWSPSTSSAPDAKGDISEIKSQFGIILATLDVINTIATSLEAVADDRSADAAAASIDRQRSRLQAIHRRMLEIGAASPDDKAKIEATGPQLDELLLRIDKGLNHLHDPAQSAAVSQKAIDRVDHAMTLWQEQFRSMIADGKRLTE
jgi:hypothetical protein